jgi:hypothetical protein
MQLTDWLDATASNYLEDFVPAGGSAVKFAIAMGDVSTSEITAGVSGRARDLGFLTATIDASRVKIGSIEKVLGSISAQIDLYDLIDRLIVNLMADQHWVAPAPGPEPLAERLATSNGIDAESLALMARPALVQKIFRSDQIAQDMRSAILGLANERLIGGESMVTAFSTIGEWLNGNLTKISSVRRYQIHSKVNRGNARFLFESLLQVIKLAGIPGMVVTVDISRFLNSEKQPEQISYAKASLLDAYEVLREFVDATDDLENFLMVVAAPMSFLDTNTKGRGLGRYPALYNRVYDEVRDRNLTNPLSALVRVGTPIEVDQ